MKALIVEDESAAAQNLQSILISLQPPIEVVALCESVVEAVDFLSNQSKQIDLIFMDIHLADGDAFKIFNRVEVSTPIIFTTAYDQYALQAFSVNSIDYLLKPIKSIEVERAVAKLKRLTTADIPQYNQTLRHTGEIRSEFASSFLIHVKDKIIPLKVDDIAFFYTCNERVEAYNDAGERFPVDKSLDAIYSTLPPAKFFRANRQFIVAKGSVRDVSVWFSGRLALNLICDTPEKIIIPKARIAEFKEWLRSQN
ncbi:MAG: LytTR family DNA-binding domain-containing protein [Rikenellaceae bacterium]